MKKFEYKTKIIQNYISNKQLNLLGEEGWELVSHQIFITENRRIETTHSYIFKRELVENINEVISNPLYNAFTYGSNAQVHNTMSFIEKLRSQLLDDDEDIDLYNLNIENIPEENGEPLDFENVTFHVIAPYYMIMSAGGDWQDGGTFKVELVNDELTVTRSNLNYDDYSDHKLSFKQIVEILNN